MIGRKESYWPFKLALFMGAVTVLLHGGALADKLIDALIVAGIVLILSAILKTL